ncbi:MAG: shikimate dehydrogenase, partial [Alphaproteobacteria bacterium]|nr:shikimate dehydrogenase [Alphaproteobacteria bacterium]
MIKAGVIGDPISHSLSPKIHNFFLQKYGIDGTYEAIHVKKDELREAVQKLKHQGFAGFNVTLPHKEKIFEICDELDETARLTGAVNTVLITPEKKLRGFNSDVSGFLQNIKNSAPDFDLRNKTCFIIGAGGASRAVVYGLMKSGTEKIFLTNRTPKNLFDAEFLNMRDFEQQLSECDLLVNTTSLGMVGQEPLLLNISKLNPSALVYDIVYKPLMTELLRSTEAHGNKIITGIGMLVEQALVGFEMWFG